MREENKVSGADVAVRLRSVIVHVHIEEAIVRVRVVVAAHLCDRITRVRVDVVEQKSSSTAQTIPNEL